MPQSPASPRALVIDDEPGVRFFARRVLERNGWSVDEAADGEEGIVHLVHAVDPPRYDLVLSDIRMPGIDGLHLYAELVIHRPDVLPHLVLYSGTLGDPDILSFLKRTAIAVIPKPFSVSQLLDAAESARHAGAA
jgi:two-component system, NtrC family, nitrogen regulation response regulator NtrX